MLLAQALAGHDVPETLWLVMATSCSSSAGLIPLMQTIHSQEAPNGLAPGSH